MATFSMNKALEVKEAVTSATIERLRSFAEGGKVDAFSMKLRHPRFKDRFTEPHFYACFRLDGKVYSEDAATVDALDALLEKDYLADMAQPKPGAPQEVDLSVSPFGTFSLVWGDDKVDVYASVKRAGRLFFLQAALVRSAQGPRVASLKDRIETPTGKPVRGEIRPELESLMERMHEVALAEVSARPDWCQRLTGKPKQTKPSVGMGM